MSSEKFENLEEDLSSSIDRLRPHIENISSQTGEQRKNAVRQAEKKVEEANFIIQEMENEAKAAPVQYRTQMIRRVRLYKKDLDQLSKDLTKKSNIGYQADNYGFDRDDRMEATQRNQLIQGTQSLNRASESIARSHQIAAETDEIGTDILGELGRQRDVLTRTKDRLHTTDSNLSKSRKILRGMARRVMTDKMILTVIVLIELGILGGVIYWKFFQ